MFRFQEGSGFFNSREDKGLMDDRRLLMNVTDANIGLTSDTGHLPPSIGVETASGRQQVSENSRYNPIPISSVQPIVNTHSSLSRINSALSDRDLVNLECTRGGGALIATKDWLNSTEIDTTAVKSDIPCIDLVSLLMVPTTVDNKGKLCCIMSGQPPYARVSLTTWTMLRLDIVGIAEYGSDPPQGKDIAFPWVVGV
ncbi:unnamed protein product [Acanthoscelides obtectus]|uniref:Uncharacterized protein n=1 Tax=Acanthoscelides obtectus TaxID=200917 RepID=A0A9P0MCB4_ACAOB|nr:unnamed protein product [Acanthoscelides obtectus]CAK1642984.1 hypothetical protein AOBTE_LOCUS13337 [Acanthoscelides obtectus]